MEQEEGNNKLKNTVRASAISVALNFGAAKPYNAPSDSPERTPPAKPLVLVPVLLFGFRHELSIKVWDLLTGVYLAFTAVAALHALSGPSDEDLRRDIQSSTARPILRENQHRASSSEKEEKRLGNTALDFAPHKWPAPRLVLLELPH